MEKRYDVTGSDRKAMVQTIGQVMGVKPVYMKVPTCAYTIGNITVDKNGTMIWDESTDEATIKEITKALVAAGYATDDDLALQEAEEPAQEATEPVELTVSLPTARHTGNTLRNLVNLIYTRAGLINKALGTNFSADQGLVDALAECEGLSTVGGFTKVVEAYEEENGSALTRIAITVETITFSSLPAKDNPEMIRVFTELAAKMNQQALDQKRIQAKAVNEENEKYALRTWLTRLGMNGPEYKETRRILMKNLSGNAAFRTDADKQRWMERQAEKRAAAAEEAEG